MVKYDATEIARGYDRARTRSPEVMALWMSAVAKHASPAGAIDTILDLGCGTGRFSEPLRAHFGARVIGVDPSKKMLAQAAQKPEAKTIYYLLGSAEDIPLRDGSVDLVFMSMIFHHLTNPARAAAECKRVLRESGTAFLRAGSVERIPAYPASRWFPASVPIMERMLSRCRSMCETFEAAGFRTITSGVIEQRIADSHAAYAEQVAAGGDSVAAQMEAAELEAGLAALRAHAAEVDPVPVTEPIDVFVFSKDR